MHVHTNFRRGDMRPHRLIDIRSLVAVMVVTVSAACSKTSETSSPKDTKSATDMKDMPGMPGMSSEKKGEEGAEKPEANANAITFTAAQVKRGGVRWEAVVMGIGQATVTVPGQVVPNEDRTARLGSPASGRVVSVRVSPGDRVSRGQVVVTLASPEAGMSQADLSKATAAATSARAQAAYATAARERAERLLALKAIPRQDYERAVADDAQAQAMLTQANAELGRAQSTATQLGGGADVTGVIALRSPLSGVVLDRIATPGAVVEMGAPLVVVTDPASLWLTINAPESMVGVFRRGGDVRFAVPSYPGETFGARIDAVGAGLDPATRTLPVRALITGGASGAGRLKPEMLASVSVAGGPSMSAVLLPEDAVQQLNGKTVAFIATPDSAGGARFTARIVETGARAGGRIAVTHGLTAGDVVVVVGAFRVKAQLQNGSMPAMEM